MAWFVFFAYLLLFCWIITRVPFFRRSGIGKPLLVALFVLKVGAGVLYFEFLSLPLNAGKSDTHLYFKESRKETRLLQKDPVAFVLDFFHTGYERTGGLFSNKDSWWNDVRDRIPIKLMAVFNLFTGSNYYANIIFFNFLFFFGLIAFFRMLDESYPGRRWLLIIATFLLPSFMFYASGIHKDGLIFSAVGMVLFCFHRLLQHRRRWLCATIMVVMLLLLFLLRNYIAFLLLPALLLGWFIHRYPAKRWMLILTVMFCGVVLVFSARFIHPKLDVARFIVDKQQQFLQLEGNTVVATDPLQPEPGSFLQQLPHALTMALLRPFPNDGSRLSVIPFLEIIVFWCLIAWCLVRRDRRLQQPAIAYTAWMLALTALVIIGYIVPFTGAIVRYRSIFLPLIIAPLAGAVSLRYITKNKM